MRRCRWLCGSAALVGLMVVAPAPAAHGGKQAAKKETVKVTAGKPSEFRFTLSKKRVRHGVVTFTVTNRGTLEHDFKIDGKVTKKLEPGKKATIRVTLHKGKLKFLCTVPGHAAAGMRGTLQVS